MPSGCISSTLAGELGSYLEAPSALAWVVLLPSYLLHVTSWASLSVLGCLQAGSVLHSPEREGGGALSGDNLVCVLHRHSVVSLGGAVSLLVSSFGCVLMECGHSCNLVLSLTCFVRGSLINLYRFGRITLYIKRTKAFFDKYETWGEDTLDVLVLQNFFLRYSC